ncbi:MAG: SDR family oxidoreductase, partial [Dictyoglomaceae bacterium]
SREAFLTAMEVSVYSLVAMSRIFKPILNNNFSIIILTYYGSEKVIPNYNVMGVAKVVLEASVRYLAYALGEENIRDNAISAGPLSTLAARGIARFTGYVRISQREPP